MLRFSATGRTHVGLVRPDNEDSGFAGPTLLLVADGVGGNAAGEVASATTAHIVTERALAGADRSVSGVLAESVAESHRRIALGVRHDPELTGMSTTLTALLTDGQRFALAHLGDSRGYVLRDDELTRVTNDHTWVAQMQDEGRLTEAQAAIHPWRNVVMRSVNAEDDRGADLVPIALREGDRVLLCSDGLSDLVSEQWIEQILSAHPDDAAADLLLDAALAAGGRDNVTLVLGTVVEAPPVAVDGTRFGAVCDERNIVDPSALRSSASA